MVLAFDYEFRTPDPVLRDPALQLLTSLTAGPGRNLEMNLTALATTTTRAFRYRNRNPSSSCTAKFVLPVIAV